jgi:hypothetical protein
MRGSVHAARRRPSVLVHMPDAAELEATAAMSKKIGDEEMPERVALDSLLRRKRSRRDAGHRIYQAVNPQAIRDHAHRVGMPADEITPVTATVVIRQDPEQPAAAA